MALLQIHQYPDPVLSERASDVRNIDTRVARLLEDMAETMYAAPGIGLAAPQVGAGERLVVLDVRERDEPPGKHLLKLVNPVIVAREGEVTWEEGCLSVPELTAPVKRARRVHVKAWTLDEQEIEIDADELLAVALQHEIDHLEGRLFLDHLSRLKRDLYRARQRKLARQGRPAGAGAKPVII
jgi:peptide deformylase